MSLVFGFRRILADTRTNTREVRKLLAKELPELGEREQLRIEAVIRFLVSTQAWLRMREEFGVPGPSRARWWRDDRHQHPRAPRRQRRAATPSLTSSPTTT